MNYYVYNNAGKIIKTGMCPVGQIINQAAQDETAESGEANADTQYIVYGELTTRPVMAAQFLNGNLVGVVAGAMVTVSGDPIQHITADGNDIPLSLSPGNYQYTIELFPYQTVIGAIEIS